MNKAIDIVRIEIRSQINSLEQAIQNDEGVAVYMQIASKVTVLDKLLQKLELHQLDIDEEFEEEFEGF